MQNFINGMPLLKMLEFKMLKEFNDSLTPEEKSIVKEYQRTRSILIEPGEDGKRKLNLMVICFIEGVRYGRMFPALVPENERITS